MKLTIELIPRPLWNTLPSRRLPLHCVNQLKYNILYSADSKCKICNSYADRIHENCSYNINKKTCTLKKVIAVCDKCNMVKHFGWAHVLGNKREAFIHLCIINNISKLMGKMYIEEIWYQWHKRNQIKDWKLDFKKIKEYTK